MNKRRLDYNSQQTPIAIVPEHLIIDNILPRFPVKSLIRFKAVCKLWLSIISSSEFVKTHLKFSSLNPHFVVLTKDDNDYKLWLLDYDENNSNVREIVRLDLDPNWRFTKIEMVGSCNGLVCLYLRVDYDHYCFRIWNPFTRKCRTVMSPVFKSDSDQLTALNFGFNYASSIDDYIIVAPFFGQFCRGLVYYFSLRSGIWKRIRIPGKKIFNPKCNFGCSSLFCVAGDLKSWKAKKRIAGFDVVDEKWKEIPFMDWLSRYYSVDTFAMNECLSLFCSGHHGSDVWVLKRRGDWKSWEKMFSFKFQGWDFCNMTQTGKCLLQRPGQGKVVVFAGIPRMNLASMGNKRKLLSGRASFLKVLRNDFSNKLMIPRTFTEYFNGDIPRWFLLEIAGSRKGCRVDTKEDENGEFYFDYGWNEFVEEQSLQIGDFLLFECEESLVLQVKIFENDGTEKTTPSNLASEYEVGSDCGTRSQETRRVAEADLWSTLPTNQCEGQNTSQDVNDGIDMETDYQCGMHDKYQDVFSKIEMETDYGFGVPENQCDVNGPTVLDTDDECRVHEKQVEVCDGIEKATGKVSVTEDGICYTLTWRKVHHLYYYLTIPKAILAKRAYLNDESVILEDDEGHSWPMKLRERHDGRMDLARGWKNFLTENDVKSGDILTFKFVSDKLIHIHIKRTTGRACQIDPPFERASQIDPPFERAFRIDPPLERPCRIDPPFERAYPIDPPFGRGYQINPRKLPGKWEPVVLSSDNPLNHTINRTTNHKVPETTGNRERVGFNDYRNSSFSMTWTHGSKVSYVHVPKAIAITQELKNGDTVLLCDSEGMEWPMKVKRRPSDGRVGLTQGWDMFWKKHNIAVGDTLVFKFVSDHVMKVKIIRVVPVHPSVNA